MSIYVSYPYDRPENVEADALIATYLIFSATYETVLKQVGNFAVGQTVGTWVTVPGVSDAMERHYQGRVISLYATESAFVLRLAFVQVNFADSFTLMMTSLVGNDVSTALQAKLVDLEFPGKAAARYRGPKQGMRELRALTGVADRPIVLNMIKPCIGFTPEEGARLFLAVAKGGVDLIKDDELLGSPGYNPVGKRTEAYLRAAEEAYVCSGKRTVYMPNISGTPRQMRENARQVIEAGAKACLVNFIFGGLDALAELCDEFGDRLFIMAHYAGMGVMDSARGGIAENVIIGILPRLAGAHAVMTMTPESGSARALLAFRQTVQAQRLPIPGIHPVVTTVGGGITPINQAAMQAELGHDCIIGIGGAIQGHPLGTTVGAQTAMAAVMASAKGIPLEEAALSCDGLKAALKIWPLG